MFCLFYMLSSGGINLPGGPQPTFLKMVPSLALLPALVFFSSLLSQAGAVEEGAGQTAACPREAERSFPVGSVHRIPDRTPPCRIGFRASGIRLAAIADGSRPDPGRRVVLDSDGRFISANARGWDAVVSVWDARGRYLSSFGGRGDGPGEFAGAGMLSLFIDDEDNVHVRDGALRWSVFSSEHEFLRRVSVVAMGGLPGTTVILDGGWALASDGRGPDPTGDFRVVDPAGAIQRTFGRARDGMAERPDRPIAYVGGATFWAGPRQGADAYTLEEWGIDGELKRVLRRDASWWQRRESGEASPVVRQMHITNNGLLYVMVRRPTREYARELARAQRRGERIAPNRRDALTEVVAEVIDTRSGELLASQVYSAPRFREIAPHGLFRGSFRGFRHEVGNDGLPFVDIVNLELAPR